MTPDQTPDDRGPSAFARLTHRMGHVYRTRVRTTTVVLIVLFIALAVFYAFSSEHYDPAKPEDNLRPVQQTEQPLPTRVTPRSTVPSSTVETPSSTSSETEPSESTSTRRSTPPRFPNPFEPRTPTAEETVEPTATPTGGGRP